MPLVFRAMIREGNWPQVAPRRDALGVVPGDPPAGDIPLDSTGHVAPATGGMSVTRSWRDLPPGRIPKRLRPFAQDARGSNKFTCWYMGDGRFESSSINDDLFLRVDSPMHGLIEPADEMTLDELQNVIAATRDNWTVIDEDVQT
jgi:hypothetical protein